MTGDEVLVSLSRELQHFAATIFAEVLGITSATPELGGLESGVYRQVCLHSALLFIDI